MGGLGGGTGSRLGPSRGLSEPARPRDCPKISDTFSPKPHTDSAGGDTENIFFLFLPPYPPTSLPALLPPPPPPSLLPPLPPTPARLPPWCPGAWWGRRGGKGAGRGGPGRLGLCPSHSLGFCCSSPGRPGKAGRRGQCPGPVIPPFLSGACPFLTFAGDRLSSLARLWFNKASLWYPLRVGNGGCILIFPGLDR